MNVGKTNTTVADGKHKMYASCNAKGNRYYREQKQDKVHYK